MNNLYPIIRRKRRPLIEADVPRDAAGRVQPVVAKPLVESGPDAPSEKPKSENAEITPHVESE
jgi:hypothetical protein